MRPPNVYVDRATGRLESERVHAAAFLHWLYNSRSGALAQRLLVGSPVASRLHGWLHGRPASRRKIRPFAERMGVDLTESLTPVEGFASFADFFTRELHPARRPLHPDPRACVAPVDGKLLAFPTVDPDRPFRIKRSLFHLRGLLRNEALVRRLAGGSMVVSRLGLADCHHVHFPADGVAAAPEVLGGRYHAGGPYALTHLVPFFTENYRMLTRLESDQFGLLIMVEVGALTVGSIRQFYQPGARVVRGQAKSCFALGGSTVVILFPPRAVVLDGDLVGNTEREMETYVRRGDSVGRRP